MSSGKGGGGGGKGGGGAAWLDWVGLGWRFGWVFAFCSSTDDGGFGGG